MTAPAHRVGDLRDRPPAPGPAPMVDPKWWRISRAVIPPAHGPMIIESNPPRPPPAHGAAGRGVERAGPVPGHHWSRRGPPGESMVLGRGPAQGRLPRADVVGSPYSMAPGARPARPAGRAPGTSSGQSGEQPPGPGHHGPVRSRSAWNRPHPGPGLAQPPSHIAPVDGLVPLLSRPQSASVLPSGLTQTIEHAPPHGSGRPPPPDATPVTRSRSSNEYFLESHSSDPSCHHRLHQTRNDSTSTPAQSLPHHHADPGL